MCVWIVAVLTEESHEAFHYRGRCVRCTAHLRGATKLRQELVCGGLSRGMRGDRQQCCRCRQLHQRHSRVRHALPESSMQRSRRRSEGVEEMVRTARRVLRRLKASQQAARSSDPVTLIGSRFLCNRSSNFHCRSYCGCIGKERAERTSRVVFAGCHTHICRT